MRRLLYLFTIYSFVLLLGGCTSVGDKGDDDTPVAAEEDKKDETAKAEGDEEGASMKLDDPASPLSQRVIYFEFDSSTIKDEYQEILAAHATYLTANPTASIVLEGHADERGTREYNIALGERRAKSVQQILTLQGVDEKQIQVISFGEERPVALGHDESAWSLNRRVEILYSGQ